MAMLVAVVATVAAAGLIAFSLTWALHLFGPVSADVQGDLQRDALRTTFVAENHVGAFVLIFLVVLGAIYVFSR